VFTIISRISGVLRLGARGIFGLLFVLLLPALILLRRQGNHTD
jgi:hypothetical protein